jgi:hypothetical protein
VQDVQQLRKNWDTQPNKIWFSDQEKRKNHFFKPNIETNQEYWNTKITSGYFYIDKQTKD